MWVIGKRRCIKSISQYATPSVQPRGAFKYVCQFSKAEPRKATGSSTTATVAVPELTAAPVDGPAIADEYSLSANQETGSTSLECHASSVDEDEDGGISDGEVSSIDKDEEDDSNFLKTPLPYELFSEDSVSNKRMEFPATTHAPNTEIISALSFSCSELKFCAKAKLKTCIS